MFGLQYTVKFLFKVNEQTPQKQKLLLDVKVKNETYLDVDNRNKQTDM